MDLDWLDLPEDLWIKILQQLDVKTLLKLSETCSTLNNLLGNTILIKKLKLRIDLINDEPHVNMFKHSNRKYRSVKCWYIYECHLHFDPSAYFEGILEILNHFSDSIREIEIDGFNISCSNLNRLIQTLKYVETKLKLDNLTFYQSPTRPTDILKSVLKIDSLSMINCDLRYLNIFDGVSVNKVKLSGSHLNQYKLFLLKHEELKGLTGMFEDDTFNVDRMFEDDKLSNVKFSLKYLDLNFAKWTNKQHALNFIRTQTELQTVFLHLNIEQYDILFLKHIINKNPNLKLLYIHFYHYSETPLNMNFDQIETNLSVTHFHVDCHNENIGLKEKMYRLFPNNIYKKVENYYQNYFLMKKLNIGA